MVKEVSAGAVVYTKVEDKFLYLLIQNKNGKHFSFPKGHIEKNESIMDTAKREVYEETGIHFEFKSDKLEVTTYLMPNGIYKDVYYFIGEASNQIIKFQESEILHAGWYTYDQVLKYLTYDNDKMSFIKLTKRLDIK
ncbi:bis(5'-nucleosyl)-tetraphosphatase [Acholeplasma granularum]|uniref:bis(5'-nucleosyl)-tetraphosphatase n=1 Tax=Acholeplasma granularum TaxID=264635 RepID=UPI0004B80096|nr:NUDIX domain-containing protein [Acholeplasma granularum]